MIREYLKKKKKWQCASIIERPKKVWKMSIFCWEIIIGITWIEQLLLQYLKCLPRSLLISQITWPLSSVLRWENQRLLAQHHKTNQYKCVLVTQSCPTLGDPWTVAHQAPLSMGFSRQEYWSGSPFPSPGDLSHPRIEPGSLALQADSLPSESPV